MSEPNQEPVVGPIPTADAPAKDSGRGLGSTTESPNQAIEQKSTEGSVGAIIAPLLNLNEVSRSVDDKTSKSARDHKEPLKPRTASSTSARRSNGQPAALEIIDQLRRASIDRTTPAATKGEINLDDTASQNFEDEMFAVDDSILPEIEAYLREKIQLNGSDAQAKDIRDFVLSRLSSAQIRQVLPPLLARLQTELGSAAVDIQSSFCMVEDLFSDVGRASPLVGMYTDEEEDMLKSLELRTVL